MFPRAFSSFPSVIVEWNAALLRRPQFSSFINAQSALSSREVALTSPLSTPKEAISEINAAEHKQRYIPSEYISRCQQSILRSQSLESTIFSFQGDNLGTAGGDGGKARGAHDSIESDTSTGAIVT